LGLMKSKHTDRLPSSQTTLTQKQPERMMATSM